MHALLVIHRISLSRKSARELSKNKKTTLYDKNVPFDRSMISVQLFKGHVVCQEIQYGWRERKICFIVFTRAHEALFLTECRVVLAAYSPSPGMSSRPGISISFLIGRILISPSKHFDSIGCCSEVTRQTLALA